MATAPFSLFKVAKQKFNNKFPFKMLRRHQIFWHSLAFFTKGKDHLSKCKHFITGSIKSNKNCFGVSTHTH